MATATFLLCAAMMACIMAATVCTATPTSPPPSPGCPFGCTCTENGLFVDCSNRGLLRLPPMSASVTKLDLSNNLLGPMINGSLEHLRQLQEVDLSHNRFLRLQLCTFTGLLHLRKVDLHGNRLRSLPSSLFADNGQVEVLDLSHNQMDVLPDLLLHTLPQLKVLNVSHNHATLMELGLRFQILTQLTFLDLSHNPFTNISHNAFESAGTWSHDVSRTIDISYCQLQNVHPQSLTSIPGLKNLSLAGNPLLPFQQVVDVLKELETSGLEVINLSNMTISDPTLFSQVSLLALQGLDLSVNAISSVPTATFRSISSLRKLDLSRNVLTGLGEGFGDLVNLVELNVSHNRLSSFKGSAVGQMGRLTSLDLSHNQLLEATEVELSALRNLRLLDLSFNTLQSVVLPGDCNHLVKLDFTSNAITTLPSMADMRSLSHLVKLDVMSNAIIPLPSVSDMRSLRFFSVSDNNLQSLGAFLFTEATDIWVANFSNNDLTSVDHRAFLPASPRVIDLSGNYLTRTQFFSWTATREVYLQNNKLNEVDQQTFYGMDTLNVLDLRHNNLSAISDETFKFLGNATTLLLSNNSLQMSNFFTLLRSMVSLESLDLGFNQIETINATSFQPLASLRSLSLAKNKLKVIPVELFHNLETLAELDISGNPFDCDCELLPLRDWLKKTTVKIKQRFNLNITNRCVTPEEHRGKLITMYSVGQFQCNTKMLYMIIFGSVGALGIIVGIIASLVCHYYGKYQKRHSANVPGHKHKKLKEDNSSQKETNRNRVDLVRVSKRPDPYGKEDLINGWVTSKQFTVAKKNMDPPPHHHKKLHQPGPPRPPLPEQGPPRNKKNDKAWKDKDKSWKDKDKAWKDKGQKAKRDNQEKRIRCVSETVPVRHPKQRHPRTLSMVPLWDEVLYDKPRVNLKPRVDRWVDVETYPTWHQPHMMRPIYHRDSGRYYTLPYPAPMPQYPPYGPDYPYRMREPQEEQDRYRPRQTRALPYPQRKEDLRIHYPCPPADYRNNQRYSHNSYAAERARDYENLRESREESWRLAQEERAYQEDFRNVRNDRQEYETDRREPDSRPAANNNGRHTEARESRTQENGGKETPQSQGNADQNASIKRGTGEVQVHRRDSDYRNAMENPVGPKTKSSTLSSEEKTSDWL
ncbi:hypothetical protein ACOMHN_044586 [Nucella lapillus]